MTETLPPGQFEAAAFKRFGLGRNALLRPIYRLFVPPAISGGKS